MPDFDPPLPRFGPYYRLETDDDQTPEVARLQVESGEIWGRASSNYGGKFRRVKAYRGLLLVERRGIEFYTHTAPESVGRNLVLWTEGELGVRVEGDYAKIEVVITRNTQTLEE